MSSNLQSNLSVASRASRGHLSRKSDVEEQLFGSKKLPTLNASHRPEDLEKIMSEVKRGQLTAPNAVLISHSDLSRMKSSAIVFSKEELINQRKLIEEQNEKQMAASRAKKAKMMEIENERKKQVPLTESELENKLKNEHLVKRAQEILNEERDEVKSMNQMILKAKVVSIRDSQLQEKREIGDARRTEEKRKDLLMEIERLKKIKFYEDLEREKKDEQKRGHHVIVEQIRERELKRLKELEVREREGQEILKHQAIVQREEVENNLKRKHQQKVLLDEIYEANQKAIHSKNEKYQIEKDEEERIIKYNKEKAQKEADYLAEQQRIRDEKEREVQRLREMQEKQFDRQSEIDALRAKRAFELADRLAREKERKEAEVRSRINQDLFEARRLQSLDKELRIQEQARLERDEFQRIIYNQKLERDLELRANQERKAMVKAHAEELKKQIALMEEKKLQEKRTLLEEGKKIKDNLRHDKETLEAIKTSKLTDLMSLGIPDKYTSELARKKIVV